MKMHSIVLALCLMGCASGGGQSNQTIQTTTPAVITVTARPSIISEDDWTQVSLACSPKPIPSKLEEETPAEYAVRVSNSKEATIQQCNKQLRVLRRKLKRPA